MKLFKKAFTLAEVLITLTIIGVVAAVTLPSLQNNVNKQALEKQTLKVYNTIMEAHDRYLADNHLDNVNTGFISNANVRRYFNIVSACTKEEAQNGNAGNSCTEYFADSYNRVDGVVNNNSSINISGDSNSFYQLADGTILSFVYTASTPGDDDTPASDAYITIGVDVNGPKGPNIAGYDAWNMPIYIPSDGNPDRFVPDIDADYSDTAICTTYSNAFGCFAHFMRNGFKFDY